MDSTLLEVKNVNKKFGGLVALDGVSIDVKSKGIVGLIGPNGAGKTTLFNVITGFTLPDSGTFSLNNKSYFPGSIHKVNRAGISRTFQNIRLFSKMSALENVMVGRHHITKSISTGVFGCLFKTKKFKKNEKEIREKSLQLLELVQIRDKADFPASNLSYGDQRRLEIARALATEPKLLALDEPAAGMNPKEKEDLKRLLLKLNSMSISLLLIEHDVKLIMSLCKDLFVLDRGKIISRGSPESVQKDSGVIDAYLGK
ncbi:MAG: ABC transporter ATP-binding protein [Betaproteobacteria bacterium TMED156]|nr:MAG: ABC transporter ATP-binding protein [Betaproteobacteria bacterium TMED156]